jgi:transketolase
LTSINTIRTLAMDAVQAANSGHPGTPMAMAPVAYCLWQQFLRFDPQDPVWPNRDRFVLSIGHASTLLYALLHLTEGAGRSARITKPSANPRYRWTP